MWKLTKKYIKYLKNNSIVFADTRQHWETGILRLLNLEEIQGREWIEYIFENVSGTRWNRMHQQEKYELICKRTQLYFKVSKQVSVKSFPHHSIFSGAKVDRHFTSFDYLDNKFHILGNSYLNHGILYTNRYKKASPIAYDEEYFEGDIERLGYGNYLKQSEWRIEKSDRILSSIKKYSLAPKPCIFDIGAGYGFLRYSAQRMGLNHFGLEISRYANEMCAKLFGFTNFEGDIWQYNKNQKYDIVTCLDVIEHVKDLDSFIAETKKYVAHKGLIVVRTPNLCSFEHKCFRSKFYSLKNEHLNYFSPLSLAYLLSRHGFSIEFTITSSHLFVGFNNFSIDCLVSNLEGSDIFMVARLNEAN